MAESSRINHYGEEEQIVEDLLASVTTSTTFQSKMTLTTPATLPAGDYILKWSYGWNHDSAGNDFEARILVDGVINNPVTGFEWMLHKQEPKDSAGGAYPPGSGSGTSQAQLAAGFLLFDSLAAGVHTFELQWRTDAAGVESTIWNARFQFHRREN